MSLLLLRYQNAVRSGKWKLAASIESKIISGLNNNSKYINDFEKRDRVIEMLTLFSVGV